MDLYPAIDLQGGRCVRLVRGDFERATLYEEDPVVVALSFARAGARWIHVVDLDAARGWGDNRAVIESLARAVGAVGVPVEVGGGVRDGTLLERGVARVVVGSLAISEPQYVVALASRYPGRVAVGLDHHHGELRVSGWQESSGLGLADALGRFVSPDLAAVIVTNIAVDGMLVGPDLEGMAAVLQLTALPVIASGGVGSLDDLRALARLRSAGRALAGMIVGKALYEGRFALGEALEALEGLVA
jgi:phosphoribosylformimino-5-aminoimidazole carboxamide ribotide isomerase